MHQQNRMWDSGVTGKQREIKEGNENYNTHYFRF